MATVTLQVLQEEGRLTIGDILTHSEKGEYVFNGADSEGRVIVSQGDNRELWDVDFGGRLVRLVGAK